MYQNTPMIHASVSPLDKEVTIRIDHDVFIRLQNTRPQTYFKLSLFESAEC